MTSDPRDVQIATLLRERDEARATIVELNTDREFSRQGIAALEAQRDALTAALRAVTEHMDRAGADGYGMPQCPWCWCSFDTRRDGEIPHNGDCELVKARAALASVGTLEQP
jgi:hypothetical protein